MKNYIVSVECVIEYEGKFLIIQRPVGKSHAAGLLSLPGGTFQEQDESTETDVLRNAVKREIGEELGLTLQDPIDYLISVSFVNDMEDSVVHTIFYCKLIKTALEIVVAKKEIAAYFWMTHDELKWSENAPEWLKKYSALAYRFSKNKH